MTKSGERRNNDRDLLVELKTYQAVMQKDITDIKTGFSQMIATKADKSELFELHKLIDTKASKELVVGLQETLDETKKDTSWLKQMMWMGLGGLAVLQIVLQVVLQNK